MDEVTTEMLDTYDDAGAPAGPKARPDVHRDGNWHRGLHCWVLAARPDGPVVLLQRRGQHTTWFPGALDITAAGHLSSGEDVVDALREIEEELGLVVTLEDLTPVGELRLDMRTATMWNREIDDVFLLREDRPLEAYTFPDGSVTGLAEVPAGAFVALLTGAQDAARGRWCPAGGAAEPIEVRFADLVPWGEDYCAAVAAAVERAAQALR